VDAERHREVRPADEQAVDALHTGDLIGGVDGVRVLDLADHGGRPIAGLDVLRDAPIPVEAGARRR
jgi:hypothetical protein